MALVGSLLQLALSLSLFFFYDPNQTDLQLVESFSLIPFFGIQYLIGIDGLSFWYIQLSALLLPLVLLSSWKEKRLSYFFFLFTLVSLLNGAFLSFDGILFYIFFELTLLPLFFLIFLYGGEQRVSASFHFLIYTFFAGLFLLAAFIFLMLLQKEQTGQLSASLLDFYLLDTLFIEASLSTQTLLFFCFAFAFAVKTPLVPFHSWLPLAHVQAPTGASVYLAALLLKLGTYGWFRFVLPLCPEASHYYAPLLLCLASFSLIYSSLVAFAQTDLKKLVAYSSVAHMSYIFFGLFAFNIYGVQGAFYQTLAHGISSAALFLMVGLLSQRTGTRQIAQLRGLALSMPVFAICFFIITLSSIALPSTAGFVAEFLVLLGSALSHEIWIYFALTGVVLGALYMLNVFQKIFFRESNELCKKQKDLNLREFLYLSPLCLLVFVMGLAPSLFLDYSKNSLESLLTKNNPLSLQEISIENKTKDPKELILPEIKKTKGLIDSIKNQIKTMETLKEPSKEETENSKTQNIENNIEETKNSKTQNIKDNIEETKNSKTQNIENNIEETKNSKTQNIKDNIEETENSKTQNIENNIEETKNSKTQNIENNIEETKNSKTQNIKDNIEETKNSKTQNIKDNKKKTGNLKIEKVKKQQTETKNSKTQTIKENHIKKTVNSKTQTIKRMLKTEVVL